MFYISLIYCICNTYILLVKISCIIYMQNDLIVCCWWGDTPLIRRKRLVLFALQLKNTCVSQ